MPTHTPSRSVRIGDERWLPLREIAAEHGETATDVIVRAIDLYVASRGYGVDPVTALERLARLYAAGHLPEDEWRAKRRELLKRI